MNVVKLQQTVTCGEFRGSLAQSRGFSFTQILQLWMLTVPFNEKGASFAHKIWRIHCVSPSNSGKSLFENSYRLVFSFDKSWCTDCNLQGYNVKTRLRMRNTRFHAKSRAFFTVLVDYLLRVSNCEVISEVRTHTAAPLRGRPDILSVSSNNAREIRRQE